MVGLKGEANINGEIKKLRNEIAEIKRYLNKLIEMNTEPDANKGGASCR